MQHYGTITPARTAARAYGVEKSRATLVRRGGDPGQTGRGPINDTLPDPVEIPSHHGPDVQTNFPELDVDTMGKGPTTQMRAHSVNVTLESEPATEEVTALLADESRVPHSRDARHRRRRETQRLRTRRWPPAR